MQQDQSLFKEISFFVRNDDAVIDFVPIKEDNVKRSVLDAFKDDEVMKWSI